MNKPTLSLVDVRHVQSYLFNANELKQNIGASALVEQATHQWILDQLPAERNVRWDAGRNRAVFDERTLGDGSLEAQVIFLGGGNAGIIFPTREKARQFARAYTDSVFEQAPGLEVAVAHVDDVDLARPGAFREAWQRMQTVEMPRQKEGRLVSQPVLGLSVTAECSYTGRPAVAEDSAGLLYSAEAYAKQHYSTVNFAKERLNNLLPIRGFEYPSQFEELGGERGHASFIAVVHADGNGMGNRIRSYTECDDNLEMIRRMRIFSEQINQVGLQAMQAVRDFLAGAIRLSQDGKHAYLLIDRFDEQMKVTLQDGLLPFRPLVYGGDDITFVCDGRLGLILAARVLESFAAASLPDGIQTHACAGVAVVHSHYPFARAYQLAEELCQSAKQQARRWDENIRVSLLNWHATTSNLTLDWEQIRTREYMDGGLLLRPLVVRKAEAVATPAWQTLDCFVEQIAGLRQEPWCTQRNKQKDLREALRRGGEVTRRFTGLHGELPKVSVTLPQQDTRRTGWLGEQCLYFDALEANDLFVFPGEVPHD
jgi:hypothetical protein